MRRFKMIYTYEDGVKKYGSKYLLKKAVETGKIYQQEKGFYADKEYVPTIAIISLKYPKAVFTMNSAFYYYNLTDSIPERFFLATDRDSAKISDKRVVQIFEKDNLLKLGVNTISREECDINIYSKERLLVELIRHKSKVPFDLYKEVIRNYREIIYDLDIQAIQEYAYEVPKTSMIMKTLQLEVL